MKITGICYKMLCALYYLYSVEKRMLPMVVVVIGFLLSDEHLSLVCCPIIVQCLENVA